MPRSLAALALALTVLLTGCTPTTPEPSTPPSETVRPLFASDEEALEAAIETLTGYWTTNNLINQQGGIDPSRLEPFTTDDWQSEKVIASAEYADNGWRQIGDITFDSTSFQQMFEEQSRTTVIISSCFDYSARIVLDSAGKEIDLSAVPSRQFFEITLISNAPSRALEVSGIKGWADKTC